MFVSLGTTTSTHSFRDLSVTSYLFENECAEDFSCFLLTASLANSMLIEMVSVVSILKLLIPWILPCKQTGIVFDYHHC